MNEKQLENLETLKEWLSYTLGSYGYTENYSFETSDSEDYTEVEVTINLLSQEEKKTYLRFYLKDEIIKMNMYEDIDEEIDYLNYKELIWRQMFLNTN